MNAFFKSFASLFLLWITLSMDVSSQVAADYAVLLTAETDESVPSITLRWQHDTLANGYVVYKKSKTSQFWDQTLGILTGSDSSYKDTDVVLDSAYEYQVEKSTALLTAYGYIYAGMKLRATEYKGRMILLVDDTFADSLHLEILRLMRDLTGDGWEVVRHEVSRGDSVAHVKSIILDEFQAHPETTRSVFLLGHVPVPYSGDLNPDGHPDHKGAWPADIYYGNLTGNFTDTFVNNPWAARPENQNIPGDGKFDQSIIPLDVTLEVGRVDLWNMPAFSLSEGELLRRYLDKDHNFRNKDFTAIPRGLIDDHFGAFSGEAFAGSGWRNFAPLVGSDSIDELPFFSTLSQDSYLWSYACGGGWYQGAGGVGTTADFAADTVKSVFTMLFGSYFGDWDSPDNFLRAPLASAGYALTSCWAGRPHWQVHHMGMGENIGYSAKLTQNNSLTYYYNYARHFVHIALMGDPSLRMHVVAPVPEIEVTTLHSTTTVSWLPSPEPVLGYYVYRASGEFGKYERLHSDMITATTFVDPEPLAGMNHYMVRAVKLEQSPSGSYYNLSCGKTDSVTVVLGYQENVSSELNQIRIFPNPGSDKVFVTIPAECEGFVRLLVTDLSGKMVLTHQVSYQQTDGPVPLNIQSLPAGVYLLRTETGNGCFHTKLVVGQ